MGPGGDERNGGGGDRQDVWLARLRAGDATATNALVTWLRKRVVAYASREMGPSAMRWGEPDDIVQQVLLETLPEIGDPSSGRSARALVALMVKRARWRILDLVNKRKSEPGQSAIPPGREHPLWQDQSRVIYRREFLRRVDLALDRIDPKLAVPLRMHMFEDVSYEEIGRRLELKPDTVRKRCSRGREKLNELLRDKGLA